MEVQTDMGQVMSMLRMMGGAKGEEIEKYTIITYKAYLDTTTALSAEEKALLKDAAWRIKLDSKDDIFTMTFISPFKKPEDVSKISAALEKAGDADIMDQTFKEMVPEDKSNKDSSDMQDLGLDMGMGMGKGKNDKSFGDMTREYFMTKWQNGKLVKKLDTVAYKRINDDEKLNSFKKLAGMAPGGEDILESITVTTKFMLPRPAKKATGKAITLSADKKTVTIKSILSDIYDSPGNFEYDIEY
jgi:hypothetical protein